MSGDGKTGQVGVTHSRVGAMLQQLEGEAPEHSKVPGAMLPLRPFIQLTELDAFERNHLANLGVPSTDYKAIEVQVAEAQPQGIQSDAQGRKFLLLGVLVPIPVEILKPDMKDMSELMPVVPVFRAVVKRDLINEPPEPAA